MTTAYDIAYGSFSRISQTIDNPKPFRTPFPIIICFLLLKEPMLIIKAGSLSCLWISCLGFVCDCEEGWSGLNCSENRVDCADGICNQGSCEELDNDYNCVCDPGYGGQVCNINLNECQPDPCENGFCTDLVSV